MAVTRGARPAEAQHSSESDAQAAKSVGPKDRPDYRRVQKGSLVNSSPLYTGVVMTISVKIKQRHSSSCA